MKVDCITVDKVTFSRFSWWSNWIDIAVFDYQYQGYLLQMRVSRTNAKSFKTRNFNRINWIQGATTGQIGNLTQMTKESK